MKLRQWIAALAVVLGTAAAPLQAGTIQNVLKDNLYQYQNGDLAPVDAASLNDVKFFAVYFSAHWCGPCRRFTPELIDFYNKTKRTNPAFELIFVSADHSRDKMLEYMKVTQMPWPTTEYRKAPQELMKLAGNGIPCLVLIDENGQILSNSFEGTRYVGPDQVVIDIDKRLRKFKGAAGGAQGKSSFDDFFKKSAQPQP